MYEDDEQDSFEMNLPQSCGSNSVCCPKEQNLKTADPKNCGLRNEVGLADFNGAPAGKAQFAEFPSIVSVEDENGKICTGSLLESRAVITSASCVYGKNVDSLQVRLGSWKASEMLGLDTEIVVRVSEVVLSSQMAVPYNRYPHHHLHSSVAILILETETKRNMLIGTSCLSSSLDNVNASDCVVVGWGNENSAGDDLNVENVNLENCVGDIPSLRCATEVKHFETGSALMCRINSDQYSYYQQVGLKISTEDSMPSLYADLNDYKRWIDKKLATKGIDSRLYTFRNKNERFPPLIVGVAIGIIISRRRKC